MAEKTPPKKEWPAMKLVQREIAELIPHARNARMHSEEQIDQLAESIRKWGWTMPVLIDEEGGIIAGHGRVLAGLQLDIKQAPCMVAKGWSEDQKRAYVIADNRLAEGSGWNRELLRLELNELDETGFDLEPLGFEPAELRGLMEEPYEPALRPTVSGSLVSGQDIDRKDAALSERFDGAQEGRRLEVICPHCAKEFYVDPEDS